MLSHGSVVLLTCHPPLHHVKKIPPPLHHTQAMGFQVCSAVAQQWQFPVSVLAVAPDSTDSQILLLQAMLVVPFAAVF